MAARSKRIVRYSRLAAEDREEIYTYTAHQRGVDQAERYSNFLADAAANIVDGVIAVRPVEGADGAYASFVKWPKAKYGHFLIFEYEPDGIHILRILHSSMDVSQHPWE